MASTQHETLAELKQRYLELITSLAPDTKLAWPQSIRIVNQVASLQTDLMCFHHQDPQAMQLLDQLTALIAAPLPECELASRTLGLLQLHPTPPSRP